MSETVAQRSGFTQLELLTCVAIVAVILALWLPGVLSSRESARLVQCKNNLRQLGVAMQSKDVASTFYEIRAEIGAGNARAESVLSVLQCPSDSNDRTFQPAAGRSIYGRSNYVGVMGEGKLPGFYEKRYQRVAPSFPGPEITGVPFRRCTDGLSNTLQLGEQDSQPADPLVAWRHMAGASGNSPPNSFNQRGRDVGAFRSQHKGGVSFLLGDASVRFIGDRVSHRVYRAMMTISAGDMAN